MRISCPSCQIAYEIPEQKLLGRKLRCAGCGTNWVPLPAAAPEPEPEPARAVTFEIPAFATQDRFPATRLAPLPLAAAPRRRPSVVLLGWIATILICTAAGLAAIHYRTAVMHIWPASIRLYHALTFGP